MGELKTLFKAYILLKDNYEKEVNEVDLRVREFEKSILSKDLEIRELNRSKIEQKIDEIIHNENNLEYQSDDIIPSDIYSQIKDDLSDIDLKEKLNKICHLRELQIYQKMKVINDHKNILKAEVLILKKSIGQKDQYIKDHEDNFEYQ